MPSPLKLGLLREGKIPPDSRAALTPALAAEVAADPRFDLVVQPSPGRCFPDEAYAERGVRLAEDLGDRDVLIGVKEVPVERLRPGKTYFCFSHTHKQQPYNRELLRTVLARGIRLIDYELLTDDSGARVIAFGRFAGMVGAHHALRAWGLRTGRYDLPAMRDVIDYAAAREAYAAIDLGDVRVVVTGTGRVGDGARGVLRDAGLAEVTHEAFLGGRGPRAAFTQLGVKAYARRADGATFRRREFYADPSGFESSFARYAAAADVLVHGIFWDTRAPALFELADARAPAWRIRVIADVTCDIAPVTSVPATVRATTIADPYFGFDPARGVEVGAWDDGAITMMTVDNLPNELPRDASASFGRTFVERVLPELLAPDSAMLERATIARGGRLTERYRYLARYVGEEQPHA